jgi:methylmalonyl-CoA carboxyltransferase small subunit
VKLRITVDGKQYEVDVEVAEDERATPARGYAPYYGPRPAAGPAPARVRPIAAGGGAAAVEEEKVCRSPLAGVVVRINTHEGQQIQPNDPLLVLEAMKMETNVTSPVAGKVKAIRANVGDAVQPGQVLVDFE